ncbi:Cytochrome P450, E-class, group I [Parasponia andersonii]|uniref:Cytochrome P450, E-class, group I n=1 Tax=Parasponia andersonii TaxID=3476 RepID=A0A2P5DA37_PARAD|nr:Cytochrome P450, E-class, group I [Parasponia andersonii]
MDYYSHDHLPSLVNITPSMVITTLAVPFFLYYYLFRKPKVSRRAPPEAGGAWPLIGHLPLFGGSQLPPITLGHMADKYGPIFTIRMGVHKTIVVSSWEIAKECFTTNDKAFAKRLKTMGPELLGYNYALFGCSVTSENPRSFAVKDIYELFRAKNAKAAEVVKVELKKWFADIALNTVFKVVVGKRLVESERSKESGGDERSGHRCRKAIRDFFDMTGAFVVSDAIPWLRWLDLGGYERAMKKTAKELDQVVEEWLEEHKRKRTLDSELVNNKVDGRDFMGVMLSILDDAKELVSTFDADTINKATCVAFILASTNATAATLTWDSALLLNNPETL